MSYRRERRRVNSRRSARYRTAASMEGGGHCFEVNDRRLSDESEGPTAAYGVVPGSHAQLSVDRFRVSLHGVDGEEEGGADLALGAIAGEGRQYCVVRAR